MKRIDDREKPLLVTRISCCNITGLSATLTNISGKTLVQYAGSLTGRDFRLVAQIAPFILYDLVPDACYSAWLALSAMMPLVWQPEMKALDDHLVSACC